MQPARGDAARATARTGAPTGADVVFVIHQIGSSADGGLRSITEMIAHAPGLRKSVVTNLDTSVTQAWARHADVSIWRMNETQYGGEGRSPFARAARVFDRLANNVRMWSVLRRLRPAVVHINDHRAFWNAILACRVYGAPVIFNVRDTMRPGARSHWAWRLALRLSSRFLVLSKEMEDAWRKDLAPVSQAPAQAAKFAYLYSIVDRSVYFPADEAERARTRARLSVDPRRPAIVYVGRFDEKKAQLRFIEEAAPRLAARAPEAVVYFVGDFAPDRDAYAAACRDAVERLGLADSVVFAGYSDAVADWYRAADVVALASQREGLPRCVIEAIACGATIAAFDVCSVREIVEANGFGAVAAQGDYAALSAAIAELSSDAARLADVRRRGPSFAAEQFDPARNGALYAQFVAQTARTGPRRRPT